MASPVYNDILRTYGADPGPGSTTPDDVALLAERGGPFVQGLRSGTYGLGAGAGALGGDVAEGLGLNPVAASLRRFSDEQAQQAGRYGPLLHSYTDVLDGNLSPADYIIGGLGQAVPSMAAAVAGGGVGRSLLRSRAAPYLGAFVPSSVLEAGETARTLYDDPTTRALPVEQRLAAEAGKGAAAGALDSLVPGGTLARRALPARPLQEALKKGLEESVTEMAQQAIGQQAHRALNPNRDSSGDLDELVDSAILGFAPGAILGGSHEAANGLAQRLNPQLSQRDRDINDLRLGDQNPELRGNTLGETSDNLVRADGERPNRAKSIYDSLSETLREGLGTDFTDKATQTAVGAKAYGAQLGERFTEAKDKFFASTKKYSRQQPDNDLYTQLVSQVKPELRDRPEVFNQLRRIAGHVTGVMKDPETSASALGDFMRSPLMDQLFENKYDAMKTMAKTIKEGAEQFSDQLQGTSSAERDALTKGSFLASSVSSTTRLEPGELKRVGRVIDDYVAGRAHAPYKQALKEFGRYFGSPEKAEAVLDFYARQRPKERHGVEPTDIYTADEDQGLAALDDFDPRMGYKFADDKYAHPFRRGEAPTDQGHVVSMLDYAETAGLDKAQEAGRIKQRLQRLAEKDPAAKAELEKAEEPEITRNRRLRGDDAVLAKYEVLETPQEEADTLTASPRDLRAMRTRLDMKKKRGGEGSTIWFKTKDGKTFALSAESMWKTWSAKGVDKSADVEGTSYSDHIKRNFAGAMAAVLARPDVAYAFNKNTGEAGVAPDLVIDRHERVTGADLSAKTRREPTKELEAARDELRAALSERQNALAAGDADQQIALNDRVEKARGAYGAAREAFETERSASNQRDTKQLTDIEQKVTDGKKAVSVDELAAALDEYGGQSEENLREVVDSWDDIKERVTPKIQHLEAQIGALRKQYDAIRGKSDARQPLAERIKSLEKQQKAHSNELFALKRVVDGLRRELSTLERDAKDREGVIDTNEIEGEDFGSDRARTFDEGGRPLDQRVRRTRPAEKAPVDTSGAQRKGTYDAEGNETLSPEQQAWIERFLAGKQDPGVVAKLPSVAALNQIADRGNPRAKAAALARVKQLTTPPRVISEKPQDLSVAREAVQRAKRSPGAVARRAGAMVSAALDIADLTPAERQQLAGMVNERGYLDTNVNKLRAVSEILQQRGLATPKPGPIENAKYTPAPEPAAQKASTRKAKPLTRLDKVEAKLNEQTRKNRVAKGEENPRLTELVEQAKKFNAMSVKTARELEREGIAAAHVSPHKHEGKFDWRAHIGKGEGNAMFGAGTYLSTDEQVHNHYKNIFSKPARVEVVNKNFADIADILDGVFESLDTLPFEENVANAKLHLESVVESFNDLEKDDLTPEDKAEGLRYVDAIKRLDKLKASDIRIIDNKAPTYHVTINAQNHELLDWDKPLSEQSPQIQKALRSVTPKANASLKWANNGEQRIDSEGGGHTFSIIDYGKKGAYLYVDGDTDGRHDTVAAAKLAAEQKAGAVVSGQTIYEALTEKLGSQEAASDKLQELGIAGHVYNAAGGKNETNRNYVIYDDSKITTNYVEFNKQNAANAAALSSTDQDAVRDEVHRILGPKIKVLFEQLGHAGEYEKKAGEEIIRLAIGMSAPFANQVAYHEAAHAFMSRLLNSDKVQRATRELLQRVASSPLIERRLRNLLAAHPDALEQLSDSEERLAYAFQFFATGQLTLPTEPRTFFQKVLRFLRDVLGVVSEYEKAELVLTAFHQGKFADQTTQGAVLRDLGAETFNEKAARLAGPLSDVMNKVMTSATDRLRGFNTPALNELADMFYQDVGHEGAGLGFIQSRTRMTGRYLNRLSDILKDTTAEERRQVLEAMQGMAMPTAMPAKRTGERIAALLKDLHEYMKDAGVEQYSEAKKGWIPLNFVNGYFPRVWDREFIRNNMADFAALLVREGGVTPTNALELAKNLARTVGDPNIAENNHHVGFTPFNGSANARKLTFINPRNAAEFAKFQSKDITEILSTYIHQAAHRGEYARSFGNDGEVIARKIEEAKKQGLTEGDTAEVGRVVMALEGTLGHDFNPELRNIFSSAMVYQNIALLPFSLFASLIDPLGVALRSGDMKDAWAAFKTGMVGIRKDLMRDKTTDADEELAKTMGLIDDQNMLENYGSLYAGMYMSKWLKNVNNKFFRWNGMEGWNRRMRIAGMVAAQRFILRHAQNPSEPGARYLKELGIEAIDVKELPDGRLDMSSEKVQEAVFKFVDGGVLRPNAAHRPVWGSDPLYMLIFHLKQFTFSFHQTITKRMTHEVKNGNEMAMAIYASYVPFMIGADLLRGGLTGQMKTGWDMLDYLGNGIDRAGVLGKGNFAIDALQDAAWGGTPGTSFLGPTAGHAVDAVQTLAGHDSWGSLFYRSVPAGPLVKAVVN